MDILPRKKEVSHPAKHVAALKPIPKKATVKVSKRQAFPLKRGAFKFAVAALNLLIVGTVAYIAVIYSGNNSTSYGVNSTSAQGSVNPLDALTAADIAANVAKMAGLPEELAVSNQAESINLYLTATVVEDNFVNKSQIASGEFKSKEDIVQHTVKGNETVSSLANQYGVTSDSIRWSNNLNSNELTAGTKLFIPPINGIVHKVGVGDTAEKLAETFKSSSKSIIAFNDAELTGLVRGDRIVIPDGVKPRPVVRTTFQPNYGFNGYFHGYCTWYVATKISVPNNWHNANMWDNYASVTPGWTVSSKPVVGAVAQTNAGAEGHVAIVEAVSEDGRMIKYSDMNGLAGWGRAGYSDWVSASHFENYLYKTN